MVGIHRLNLGIQTYSIGSAVDGVLAVDAIAEHLNGHIVIHSQCVCYGLISEWIDHHILTSEITQDVRLVKSHILGGEKGVSRIGLTVGIRNIVRVDATREITLRWCDFPLEISILQNPATCRLTTIWSSEEEISCV